MRGVHRKHDLLLPHFVSYSPLFLKVFQVSDRLPGGKPFLGNREEIPGVTNNIPAHLRGYLKSMFIPFFKNGNNLVKPLLMVLFQFLKSRSSVPENAPMARQYKLNVQLTDLV